MDGEDPIGFLGPIRLSELSRVEDGLRLPREGVLHFFGDIAGKWNVLFDPNENDLAEVQPPPRPIPEPANGWRELLPQKKPRRQAGSVYKQSFVQFELVKTYPPADSDAVEGLDLDEEDSDELSDLIERVYTNCPAHDFFGYP